MGRCKINLFLIGLFVVLSFPCKPHASPTLSAEESIRQEFSDAQCFLIQEQYQDASSAFQRLVGRYKVLEDYIHYYLAQSLMEEGKYREAIPHWEILIRNHPRSRFAKESEISVADCYFELGEFGKASVLYSKKSLYDGEKDAKRLFRLGLCLEWDGKFKKAGKAYYKIWSAYPKAQYASEADIRISTLQKENKIPAPSEPMYYTRIIKLMKSQGHSEAIEEINVFLQKFPQSPLSPKIYTRLGSCYRLRRNYPKAIDAYRNLVRRYKGANVAAEGYYYLSSIYWNRNMPRNPRTNLWVISSQYPDSKWADKALFMLGRIDENKQQYKKAINAYDLLWRRYPNSDRTAEALWRIGWIYYQQGKYDLSAKHLGKAAKKTGSVVQKNNALYWRGRSLEKLNKIKAATSSYRSVLKNNFRGYYAYLSKKRFDLLKIDPGISPIPKPNPSSSSQDMFKIELCNSHQWPDRLEKVRELNAMVFFDEAVEELLYLNKKECKKKEFWIGLSRLYRINHNYIHSIRAIYRVYHDTMPLSLWRLLYPNNFEEAITENTGVYNLDPYLVLALIRQESVFDYEARSWANAYGLMQIIPSTGKRIAKELKRNPFNKEMLYNPETNIAFGTWYLAGLLREFKGDIVLALAAYNAGEKAARKWKKKKDKTDDLYRFIENIPYPETRKYIKQILKNYQNYLWLYKENNSRLENLTKTKD